jgi:F0F1-type ATP synthase epsilon subunit
MAVRQIASTGQFVEDSDADADNSNNPTMFVKVHSPFKVYYEGRAYSLSASNQIGPFDILPRHHNFICMLVPGIITLRVPGAPDIVIKISRAVLHVKADRAIVFLDV